MHTLTFGCSADETPGLGVGRVEERLPALDRSPHAHDRDRDRLELHVILRTAVVKMKGNGRRFLNPHIDRFAPAHQRYRLKFLHIVRTRNVRGRQLV